MHWPLTSIYFSFIEYICISSIKIIEVAYHKKNVQLSLFKNI